MSILEVLWRTVFSIVVLFFLAKMMGYRQISQLSFYDYIIGISIGSISADLATGLEVDIWFTLIPLVLYSLTSITLSFVTNKSMKARRFLTGVPVILIENGKIIRDNLTRVHYDINDLLAECRTNGYFDVNDLQYVVMEHTGKLSFLPNPSKRPCNPKDLNLNPAQEGLVANLIIDGKVMEEHLKKIGKEEQWLKKQLESQKVGKISDVLLATYDVNGQFSIFLQNRGHKAFDVLE